MAMTLSQAKAAVKALGGKLTYSADYNEYAVKFGPHEYFTDHRDDALDTAVRMSEEWRRRGRVGKQNPTPSWSLGRPLTFEALMNLIQSGDRVTIVNRFGQQHTGRAVMKGPAGWVLNMGGRYGTPGIADERNTVKIVKARKGKG